MGLIGNLNACAVWWTPRSGVWGAKLGSEGSFSDLQTAWVWPCAVYLPAYFETLKRQRHLGFMVFSAMVRKPQFGNVPQGPGDPLTVVNASV